MQCNGSRESSACVLAWITANYLLDTIRADSLVLPVHDHHTIIHYLERIAALQPVSHRLKLFIWLKNLKFKPSLDTGHDPWNLE